MLNVQGTREAEFSTLIDTGFDGFLSIPKYLSIELGLKVFGKIKLNLASGYSEFADVAKALITLPNQNFGYILVDVIIDDKSEDVLLGSKFLELFCKGFDYDLLISFINSNIVFQEPK